MMKGWGGGNEKGLYEREVWGAKIGDKKEHFVII